MNNLMNNYINVIHSGPSVPNCFEDTFEAFNKKVNVKIIEGYKAIGGVQIFNYVEYDDLKYRYERMRVSQTMIKE